MILNLLRKQGLRRGLLGGSRGWLMVWAAAATLKLLRRVTKSEPRVVFCEELEPGQSLVITSEQPSSTMGG